MKPVIEPMNYFMSAEDNIDGVAQTTLSAIRSGLRTSTTRSYWIHGLPKIGQLIKFVNSNDHTDQSVIVRVVSVKKIPKSITTAFLSQWSLKERWTVNYAIRTDLFYKKGLYQVIFELEQHND